MTWVPLRFGRGKRSKPARSWFHIVWDSIILSARRNQTKERSRTQERPWRRCTLHLDKQVANLRHPACCKRSNDLLPNVSTSADCTLSIFPSRGWCSAGGDERGRKNKGKDESEGLQDQRSKRWCSIIRKTPSQRSISGRLAIWGTDNTEMPKRRWMLGRPSLSTPQ